MSTGRSSDLTLSAGKDAEAALGLGFTAAGLLPPFMKKEAPVGAVDGSPAQARQLLTEAGLAAPEKLRLLLTWGPKPYLPDPQAAAKTVAESLRTLGTEVTIVQTKDRAEYAGYLQRGDRGGCTRRTASPSARSRRSRSCSSASSSR